MAILKTRKQLQAENELLRKQLEDVYAKIERKKAVGYEVTTYLNPPVAIEVEFSLEPHDWLKFEKSPEWRAAVALLESLQKG